MTICTLEALVDNATFCIPSSLAMCSEIEVSLVPKRRIQKEVTYYLALESGRARYARSKHVFLSPLWADNG